MARLTLATASAALAALLVVAASLPALAAEPGAESTQPKASTQAATQTHPPDHATSETPAVPALRPGSSGPAVLQLQLALYDAGANLPLTAHLDELTSAAVAALHIDPAAPLKPGDSGPAVAALQRALTDAGYPVEATGRLGPLTESLVRRFQLDHHLQPNGAIDLDDVERATALYTVLGYLDGLVGSRYAWGGASPQTGFDCSGLVRYVYAQVGIRLTHSSYAQWNAGMPVRSGDLKPGDLVFFSTFAGGPSHVGIYVGHDLFIHSENPEQGVAITSLDANYWFHRFVGARRVL